MSLGNLPVETIHLIAEHFDKQVLKSTRPVNRLWNETFDTSLVRENSAGSKPSLPQHVAYHHWRLESASAMKGDYDQMSSNKQSW